MIRVVIPLDIPHDDVQHYESKEAQKSDSVPKSNLCFGDEVALETKKEDQH